MSLRVAVLSAHTCPLAPLGGWETGGMNVYVRELGRALAARGVGIDIFTRRQSADVADVVEYQPGESNSGLFGGNSNWRGPVWLPVNYMIVEALQQYHTYYGDDFKVECPTGSGRYLTLKEVAGELCRRLMTIFTRDGEGRRAVFGEEVAFQNDPRWRDYVPFHEYFHGDSGRGVGASHQTGWTGLIAYLIQQVGEWLTRPAGQGGESET